MLSAVIHLIALLPLFASAWGDQYPGALYVLTNNVEQEVLVSALGSDGRATFARLVPTGGKGAGPRLDDATNGMDPLEAQHGVVVAGQYLFAVNSGSNDISVFLVDQQDPTTIIQVGQNTWSGGDYPVALAINPEQDIACVINSGVRDGLQCFYLGLSGMRQIPNSYYPFNLNQTNPPAGPPNTPSDVLFSKDGKRLYVSVKGNGTSTGPNGYVEVFSVENEEIKKIGRAEPQKGGLAFSMTLFPDSDTIFVTDPGSGADFVQFNANGSVQTAFPFTIPGQAASCWSAYSYVTGLFYVSDTAVAALSSVYANSSSLSSAHVVSQLNITNSEGKPAPTLDLSIAHYNDKQDYLYLNVDGDQTIRVFSLTPDGDSWNAIQTYTIGAIVNATSGSSLGGSMEGSAIYMKPGSW